jgi:tRNA 2-thiocytidine biosynthesis protein TtcA
MEIPLKYSRSHAGWFATPVLRAIARYGMISQGERVAVAHSGGKDSSALLLILDYLRRHSHLRFELLGIHVRMGQYDSAPLQALCTALHIPYMETRLEVPLELPSRGVCSLCARVKRGAMTRALVVQGIRKLAMGHHAEDLAQTFLMNLARGAGIRAFAPVVAVPGQEVELIRPVVYLREATLAAIHRRAGIPLVGEGCPLGQETFRIRAREALRSLQLCLGEDLPTRIVAALERAAVLGRGPARGTPQVMG